VAIGIWQKYRGHTTGMGTVNLRYASNNHHFRCVTLYVLQNTFIETKKKQQSRSGIPDGD
jgi:hypothetical protein